jgi:hypothetical protein
VKTLAKVMMISNACVAERIADTVLDGHSIEQIRTLPARPASEANVRLAVTSHLSVKDSVAG